MRPEKKAQQAPGQALPKSEAAIHIPEPGKKEALSAPEAVRLVSHEAGKLLGKTVLPGAQPEAGQSQKIKELEERLMRLQAEFENYQKRAARENEMVRQNASADVILKLLPVVDEFDIAMSHVDKASHKDFKQGMEMIYSKLLDLLKKEGVEPSDALGERFDPYRHDAIRQGEGEAGKIVEVIQKGYSYKGKILRHAKVVVGRGKEGN